MAVPLPAGGIVVGGLVFSTGDAHSQSSLPNSRPPAQIAKPEHF
jgi:hypothetical protein